MSLSSKWVSSAEMLPDDEILVLVALEDGEVGVAYHEADFWRDGISCKMKLGVTHWIDFPEPPRTAEDGDPGRVDQQTNPVGSYEVLFRKQIHGSQSTASSLDEYVERKVWLPIPPAVGMEVSMGDWCGVIETIFINAGRCHAYTESDREIYNALSRGETPREMEEIIAEYLTDGWSREGGEA